MDDSLPQGTGLNKEMKIGLAVLAVLLIVFGVVLVRRLMWLPQEQRPGDPASLAAAADATPGAAADRAGKQEHPAAQTFAADRPTVLSPASWSKAPMHAPDETSTAGMGAENNKAGRSAPQAATAFMPNALSGAAASAAPDPPAAGGPAQATLASTSVRVQVEPAAPVGQAHARSGLLHGGRLTVDPAATNSAVEALQGAAAPASAHGGPAETPARPLLPLGAAADRYPSTADTMSPPGAGYGSGFAASPGRFGAGAGMSDSAYGGMGSSFGSRGRDNSRADGSYEVQPNDNFWTISQRVYGSGAYFRALAKHNRGKVGNPDRLRVGEMILAPAVAQLEQAYPDLCPKLSHREAARGRAMSVSATAASYGGGRAYVVQEGDTLFDIARHELGKASRWAEIYEMNREALGKDFDYLTPGMQLTLPAKDSPRDPGDKTTSRPGAGYR
ncbi:MAG: LysM domain-containing protein [Thermoguttaceae bacterium]